MSIKTGLALSVLKLYSGVWKGGSEQEGMCKEAESSYRRFYGRTDEQYNSSSLSES
jgi:hypothetical protein